MLSVYLDQNAWIAVAQVMTGHQKGGPYVDTVKHMFDVVSSRKASFPLSQIHIEETTRMTASRRRFDLAKAMVALSRRASMAPFSALIGSEIDGALHRRFGRPDPPEKPQPFGVGLAFACGLPPDSIPTNADDIENAVAEMFALAKGDVSPELVKATAKRREDADRYQASEAGNATRFAEAVRNFGFDRAFVTVAGDLQQLLIGRLIGNGISLKEFAALGPVGLTALLRDIPSLRAITEMRMAKLRNTSARWDRNDLADVRALGVAAVYCNAIVSERSWIGYMHRGGVADWCKAILLPDLNQLTTHLPTL